MEQNYVTVTLCIVTFSVRTSVPEQLHFLRISFENKLLFSFLCFLCLAKATLASLRMLKCRIRNKGPRLLCSSRTAAEWWDRRTDRRTPDCCVNSAPHRPTMRALPIMAADISYRFSVSAMRNEVKVICKKLLHNMASFYAVWHRVCIAIRLLCLMSFDFIIKITDIRVILVIWNRINKLKN